MARVWTDTADGHRCDLHNQEFLRGEVCTHCSTSDLNVSEDSSDSAIDADILADAARYGTNAKTMWRHAKELLAGTAQDKSVGCKASDCAIKWERLRLEAKDKVAARKHLREAMAHEREMTTARRAH